MLNKLIVSSVSLVMLTAMAASIRDIITPLREMVQYQEQNVSCMEQNGFSGAVTVRAQWDAQKAQTLNRIDALAGIATEIEMTGTALTK